MKDIYWKPKEISKSLMILLTIFSLVGLMSVEYFLSRKEQPYLKKKIEAAKYADKALKFIKEDRKKKGIIPAKEFDPLRSGLIGYFMTPVTSNSGVLEAKQTSINPNFAAVIIEMLKKAKVKEGDTIAVGLSGSFPALNICTYAAAHTMQLKVISISSVSASQWGANDPDFLWIDIEKLLYDERIFPYKSVAASLGGIEDNAIGVTTEGKNMLLKAIERNNVQYIESTTLSENITRNVEIFKEQAGANPIKAYINVGGGSVSVGTKIGKKAFKMGLNLEPPVGIKDVDSVMTRFINEDIPVIHFTNIKRMAVDYGLPIAPKKYPKVGEGKIFFKKEYNVVVASIVFISIISLLYLLFKTELGIYIFNNTSHSKDKKTKFEPTI